MSRAGREASFHIYRKTFISVNIHTCVHLSLLKLGLPHMRIYMHNPSGHYIQIYIYLIYARPTFYNGRKTPDVGLFYHHHPWPPLSFWFSLFLNYLFLRLSFFLNFSSYFNQNKSSWSCKSWIPKLSLIGKYRNMNEYQENVLLKDLDPRKVYIV